MATIKGTRTRKPVTKAKAEADASAAKARTEPDAPPPRRAQEAPGEGRAPGKALVVVESPAKARTIGKYLGRNFVVKASLGHVKDLPKRKLGVDIDHDFEPVYEIIPTKRKVIQDLKQAAKQASAIYLAADPDREGEAICEHLAEELGNGKLLHRLLFNEITKRGIEQAFRKPTHIDEHLVAAQQARRILDRLVGYRISPLLWDKVRRGLSAGRVQTVALRLIVEREREVRAFQPREYWTIDARLEAKNPPEFTARAIKRVDSRGPAAEGNGKLEIANEREARALEAALKGEAFVVHSVTQREKRRHPVPPFITSKLQQEAWRQLNLSAKRTMTLAQRLYEGVRLGPEGSVGLITYMRTDSTRVAGEALAEARQYVAEQYGGAYLPAEAVIYRSKKGAQDAHEAIRPTSVLRTPDSLAPYLQEDELKLYRLIWQRFVASQMNPAMFDQTTIDVLAGRVLFRATGSVLKFDGFLKVYREGTDQKDEDEEELSHKLPQVREGERLKLLQLLPEQHFTEPPPRYNEATLVKELEEKGIGRPSTYAQIMSVIQEREYVEKRNKRFYPTELGTVVNDLLVDNFGDIFDVLYTARMEEELDEIEEGKLEWHEALRGFWTKFEKDLALAERNMADIKRMERPTDVTCDKCGKPMVIRWGRHGSFIACTGYPECTNTREFQQNLSELDSIENGEVAVSEAAEKDYGTCPNCGRPMTLKRGRFGQFYACTGYPDCKTTRRLDQVEKKPDLPLDEQCPQCGSRMAIRHGRFGEFTACSNYPKCKYIKQKTTGVPCPRTGCQGELVERRSRRGKVFYGCSKYPDCDFVAWSKPVPEKCPKCGSSYLLEKASRKGGTMRVCPNEECDYRQTSAA
jgi:DNA topoisomerase-1